MWTNSRLLAQGSRWLAQGSRQRKKKKKQVQKVSRREKWKVWKSICMCLHDQNRMTHSMFVFPTWKYGEAGTAKTPIYPIAQLDALKFAPTSTVSPSKTTAARDAEWTSTSSASDRGGDRCSWLLYRLKQHERQRRRHNCVCEGWTWLFWLHGVQVVQEPWTLGTGLSRGA